MKKIENLKFEISPLEMVSLWKYLYVNLNILLHTYIFFRVYRRSKNWLDLRNVKLLLQPGLASA